MQNTSDTYKAILSNQLWSAETRLTIGGVAYSGPILALSVNGGLFSDQTPTVGCCVSREINLAIFPDFTIPRMAEIKIETRLVVPDLLTGAISDASEWLQKGTFYIDTRREDPSDGSLTIHGYDAMLKMEQVFLADGEDLTDWPKTMPAVMELIAAKIGVELDERNVLNDTYMVEAPVGYTMREVAGWIAAAHAGNWTITDAGKLRLVPLYNTALDISYLADEDGNAITFGGVMILV